VGCQTLGVWTGLVSWEVGPIVLGERLWRDRGVAASEQVGRNTEEVGLRQPLEGSVIGGTGLRQALEGFVEDLLLLSVCK